MSKSNKPATEASSDLLNPPEVVVDEAGASAAVVDDADPGPQGIGDDLAAQLAAAKAELAEVQSAAETAIGELKTERDSLSAEKSALEAQVVDLQEQITLGTAANERLIEENDRLLEAREGGEGFAAGFGGVARENSAQFAAAEPELHAGPYVVMQTSSVADSAGELVARGRVATGPGDRLRELVEDDKARRARVREVETAIAKGTVAPLA